MNRRALLVALIVSFGISFFLWQRLQPDFQPPEVEAPVVQEPVVEKRAAIVSVKDLPARLRLEPEIVEDAFEIKEFDKDSVPENVYTDLASITFRFTAVPIFKGDFVVPQRLSKTDLSPNLSKAIPTGKRAVTIAVNRITSVGGFVRQGDYVDVIATLRTDDGDSITRIVLQDIKVLAVGTTYQFEDEVAIDGSSISAMQTELLTFAVTPEELENLMHLDHSTSFRLVLKNPDDKGEKVMTVGASQRRLLDQIASVDKADPEPLAEFEHDSELEKTFEPVEVTEQRKKMRERVLMQYGITNQREIIKYGGPSAKYWYSLPHERHHQNQYTKDIDYSDNTAFFGEEIHE